MLLAALVAAFLILFGGSSENLLVSWVVEDARKQFAEVIQDKERSGNAMEILGEMAGDAEGLERDLEAAWGSLEKLVKDYHSPREDFEQLFAETQKKREAAVAGILDRMPDLKRNIRREEWAKAFEEPGAAVAAPAQVQGEDKH